MTWTNFLRTTYEGSHRVEKWWLLEGQKSGLEVGNEERILWSFTDNPLRDPWSLSLPSKRVGNPMVVPERRGPRLSHFLESDSWVRPRRLDPTVTVRSRTIKVRISHFWYIKWIRWLVRYLGTYIRVSGYEVPRDKTITMKKTTIVVIKI